MVHSRKALLDPQQFAELDELFTGELSFIVRDYLLWNSESVNDITPDKLLYLCRGYLCELLCFCPFGEVINNHNSMLASTASCRKWPDQVDAPHSERSRAAHLL